MGARINWIGQRFGMLEVVEYAGKTAPTPGSHGTILVRCRCACGRETVVKTNNLRSGNTTSCGCRLTDHGMQRAPEYRAWERIIDRCHNPNRNNFHNYGGRGITVCDRWRFGEGGLTGFEVFYLDVGPRPPLKYPSGRAMYWLERRNNDLGYFKENCYWAVVPEQQNNKRTNRLLTHEGRTMTVSQWARETGLPSHVLFRRLRNGWEGVALFSTPSRQGRQIRSA